MLELNKKVPSSNKLGKLTGYPDFFLSEVISQTFQKVFMCHVPNGLEHRFTQVLCLLTRESCCGDVSGTSV